MDESSQRLNQAKAYQRSKQKLMFLRLFLTPLVLLLIAATPLSGMLSSLAGSVAANSYMQIAIYFLLFSLATLAVLFPLSWYSGYHLEHRFGLSNHTPASWLGFQLKQLTLSFALSLALVECLYALIRSFPQTWWLLAWAGYALVSYVLGKLLPVWIVPLFYQYGKVEDPELCERIFSLARRYGMPVENLYSLNLSKTTKKANAAFMGLGKTKRVVLSDTLIDNFSEDEIEVVVAHELGHFKHRDIWKNLGFGLLASFAGFWLTFQLLEPLLEAWGYAGAAEIAGLPALFLLFYVFEIFLMPLQSGFSRRLERAADRFALEALLTKDAFISCMQKLGEINLADTHPHPLYEWFFCDHPSIGKRISMARAFEPVARKDGA